MSELKREYADCYFCGGKVTEEIVEEVRRWKGRVIIIEGVPAGVCNQCGERYYWSDVVEEMDRIMQASEEELTIRCKILVPVVGFEAQALSPARSKVACS